MVPQFPRVPLNFCFASVCRSQIDVIYYMVAWTQRDPDPAKFFFSLSLSLEHIVNPKKRDQGRMRKKKRTTLFLQTKQTKTKSEGDLFSSPFDLFCVCVCVDDIVKFRCTSMAVQLVFPYVLSVVRAEGLLCVSRQLEWTGERKENE